MDSNPFGRGNRRARTKDFSAFILSRNPTIIVKKEESKLRNIEFLWDLKKPIPKVEFERKVAIRAANLKDEARLRKIATEAYLPEW